MEALNKSKPPDYTPNTALPTSTNPAFDAPSVHIDYLTFDLNEDLELFFVSPKEVITFPLKNPAKIHRAFDTDYIRSETLLPDTIGFTRTGSEILVRSRDVKKSNTESQKTVLVALSYSPSTRETLEQEMSLKPQAMYSEHNLSASAEALAVRDLVFQFVNNRFEGDRLIAEALLNLAIVQMLYVWDKHSSKNTELPPKLDKRRQDRVLDYIEANLEKNIGLDELGEAAALSKYHFSRCFKNAMGKSPYAYLVERRIDKVKTLLVGTNRQLSDIASSCGFSSSGHMSQLFKKHTGTTPLRYRGKIKI